MRITNVHKNSILSPAYLLGAFALIIYEMLSTAFIYMPPLMGVFFTYLIISKSDAQRSLSGLAGRWYLAFGFLIFAEQLHGYEFLSCVIAFIVFYYMVHDWLIINIKSRFFMIVIFNASVYLGVLLASNLFLYVLNENLLRYSSIYLYYIAIESVISFLVFKEARL